MGGTFIRFSREELADARQADTMDVIERSSGFTFKRNGDEYKSNEHDSLTVYRDRKGWTWYSRGISGANAVDWLVKVENMRFTDAVAKILGKSTAWHEQKTPIKRVEKTEIQQKRELIPPEKYQGRYDRVMAYLTKTRCIDPKVVQHCFAQHILYQDDHNNCVFCGLDADGNIRYAMKRGTLTRLAEGQKPYKRECAGSDKSYGFVMEGTVKEHIYVFEAPIDALSHATLNNIKSKHLGLSSPEEAFLKHTRIALGGTCPNALDRYLKEHPECREISLCLDNDEAGTTNSQKLAERFKEQGYKVNTYSLPQHCGKDYNEFLQKYTAEQAARHKTVNQQRKL